jgi:hypothetical protein
MESVKYYEVDFDNEYGMCILGLRQPTIEEAKEFCKKDMELWGAKEVVFISETDYETAISCYSMENEASFPIFGL